MNAFHQLAINLDINNKDLVIPLPEENKFFVVEDGESRKFLEMVLELKEKEMTFTNVVSSQPYSHSLDKATIVNSSNGTVMQQETFSKSTTDSFTFTNTKGYTKGGTVTATIGTTLLGGIGTNLNASFNLSQNASSTASQTTQRGQQQTITVPPKTSLCATWIIKNVDISADYLLTLDTAIRSVVNTANIPGSVKLAEPPVVPVYKYVHDSLDAFKYLPGAKLDLADWHLASVDPMFFFVPGAFAGSPQIEAPQGHLRHFFGGHDKQKQLATVPAVPSPDAGALSRRGSKGGWFGRGSKEMLPLDKDAEAIRNNTMVPIFSIPSPSDHDHMVYSTVDQSGRNLAPTFLANSQNIPGTVALWRYRSVDPNMPLYRLEAEPFAKVYPGWINEGIIGFVHTSVPAWRPMPEDSTIRTKHAHPLVQGTADKKHNDKCSKCVKRLNQNDPYWRCETCKTYNLCAACYNAMNAVAEDTVKLAVSRFHEMFTSIPDKVKALSVAGTMQGTQGTHTYITIDPLSDDEAKKEKAAAEGGLVPNKAKAPAKKPAALAKMVDEDEEYEEDAEEQERAKPAGPPRMKQLVEQVKAKQTGGNLKPSSVAANRPAPPPASKKPIAASAPVNPRPMQHNGPSFQPASHHQPQASNGPAVKHYGQPMVSSPDDVDDDAYDASSTPLVDLTDDDGSNASYSDQDYDDGTTPSGQNAPQTAQQEQENNRRMAQMISLSNLPIPPPPPPPPAFDSGMGGGMMMPSFAPTNMADMYTYNPSQTFQMNQSLQPAYAPVATQQVYSAPAYIAPGSAAHDATYGATYGTSVYTTTTTTYGQPATYAGAYNPYMHAQQTANVAAMQQQMGDVSLGPEESAESQKTQQHKRFAMFRRNRGDPGYPQQ